MAWANTVVGARLRASVVLAGVTAFSSWPAGAELLPEPRAAKPPAAVAQRMDTVLWEADALWHALGMISVPYWDALTQEFVRAKLEAAGLQVTPAFDVLLEVVGPDDGVIHDPDEELRSAFEAEVDQVRTVLARNGARIHSVWMRRVSASVPVGALERVARELPAGYRLRQSLPPGLDAVYGEGPIVTNSAEYRDAGADGAGVTIGVIDAQYDNFNAAVLNGDAPAGAIIVDYCTDPNVCAIFGAAGPNRHGTGCVEAAYDHAPGATWRLYRIRNLTDLGSAVQDMIANAQAPRLITHSLSWYNTGWADDTGAACAAALQAAQAGILFFTSAGNRAQSHYQATFAPAPGNPVPGWHQFAEDDETNDITIPAGERVDFYLQWNNADNVTDYDLYLYNADITVVLARSINVGAATFEYLTYTNTTGAPVVTHLGVRRVAGCLVEFEIFERSSTATWEYLTPASSTTSPSNTNHRNVVSVGAVHHANFNQPNGTSGLIEPYSSRGPTNGGLMAPDLCGPTNTAGFSYPVFTGTSCATPNVAGMVAALWSAGTGVLPQVTRDAVYEWALALRDWGPAGRENTYGRGGAVLPRVSADIMPNQFPNPIVLGREYTIYVGMLADDDTFTNVTTVDAASVRFGRALNMAAAVPVAPAVQIDLNGDARQDLLFGFRTSDVGFNLASWRGVIRGYFTNGAPFACWDSVVVLMPFRVPAMQGDAAPSLWRGPRAGGEQ